MIRAIAIDDEPLALKVIESFCKEVPEIQLIQSFTKPLEAIEFVSNCDIDLLFLDIKMPSITGIEVAGKLKGRLVIFTTAYSDYAVDGFDLNAVDYLLKPFTKDRFLQAVDKAKQFHLLQKGEHKNYFFVKADYQLNRVDFDDILYIEGLDDYLKIHLNSRKPLVARMTMKGVLEQLPLNRFVRVHRSFIIPLSRIKGLKNKAVILPELEIPIGNSYEEEFLILFNKGV